MAKKTVSKGDIIRLDYKAYISETDKVFDTTMEQAAKDAEIYNEKYTYAPMPYLVGSAKIFPALDDAIMKADVGKETKVTITSAEGAGARDPKLVEVHPIKEFYKQDINPYPGLEVALGNKRGTVMSVGAGRVRVDFNNPLAGKDVVYEFTVKEVIDKADEKAKAIMEMDFGISDDFKFDVKEDKVVVTLPELTKFHQDWPVARFKIVADLRDAFNVDTVEFLEIWSRAAPKEEKEEKKKAAPKKDAEKKTVTETVKEDAKKVADAVKKDVKKAEEVVKKEAGKVKAAVKKDDKPAAKKA